MQTGFGLLRLSSSQFWAMTLNELEAAGSFYVGFERGENLSRKELNTLMSRYPDVTK